MRGRFLVVLRTAVNAPNRRPGARAGGAAAGLTAAGRVLGENTLKHRPLLEAATLAVKAGADVNAVDDFGNTPLHYAAYNRVDAVVRYLG